MAVANWHVILVEGVHTIHVSSVRALFLIADNRVKEPWL